MVQCLVHLEEALVLALCQHLAVTNLVSLHYHLREQGNLLPYRLQVSHSCYCLDSANPVSHQHHLQALLEPIHPLLRCPLVPVDLTSQVSLQYLLLASAPMLLVQLSLPALDHCLAATNLALRQCQLLVLPPVLAW